jgi:hypothetical protein
MKLVQWHTPPPQLEPKFKEYTRIQLAAPYAQATPKLRQRLDEFVAFLTKKDYVPEQSFTELTYRYRQQYNGEEPPLFMSYVTLFVRVATVEELQRAVSAGWTWDRIIPNEFGPDCNGIPGKIWTLHSYAENVQNFRLPVRDPSHNYGITQINALFGDSLQTVSETHACCGKELSHPGCWTGTTKYELVPYDMAPSFGDNVWPYVVRQDWNSVRLLWEREPRKGSMWLHEAKYDEWDRRIRVGKASLSDAIVEVLQIERATNGADLNPMKKLQPLDRATLDSLLALQNAWNSVQCKDTYDLFNLDEGNRIFARRLSLFNTTQANRTYDAEFYEIDVVQQAHPQAPAQMFDAYRTFVQQQQTLDERLAAVPAELQRLPQFEPLRKTRVIGDPVLRAYINDVIIGRKSFDATAIPAFADTISNYTKMRVNAFLNLQDANVAIPAQFEGLRRSEGLSRYPQDLRNQYLIYALLGDAATDEDLRAVQEADAKQLQYVQAEKARLMEPTLVDVDETRIQLQEIGNNDYISTFDARVQTMKDARDNGTYAEFIAAQNKVEESILNASEVYADFKSTRESLTAQVRALQQQKQVLLQERRGVSMPEIPETPDNLEGVRDALQEQIDRLKVIPTDAQIAMVVNFLRNDEQAPQEWIDRASRAKTVEELDEIEKHFILLPTLFIKRIRIWQSDWPEDSQFGDKRFDIFFELVQNEKLADARRIYGELKVRYEELLEAFLNDALQQAFQLRSEASEYVQSKYVDDFEATYTALLQANRYRPAKDFLQRLVDFHKQIVDQTVKKADKHELIVDIDNQNDTQVYEWIRNSASSIVTQRSFIQVAKQFENVRDFTKELTERLERLEQSGYTDEELKDLWRVRNRPKLTTQDVKDAKAEFDRLAAKLPQLFPIEPAMQPPVEYSWRNFQSFCNSIPESSGSSELDDLLREYCKVLLPRDRKDEPINADDYRTCWKLFVAAVIQFPGKQVEFLTAALKANVRGILPENHRDVYVSIEKLIEDGACFNLVPEYGVVWNFKGKALLDDKQKNYKEIIKQFLSQTLDAEYQAYGNFIEFAQTLRDSNYATKYDRYLKGESDACNDEFIEVLQNIEDKTMVEVNAEDYSSFTRCLDRLDNTWTFIWLYQKDAEIRAAKKEELVAIDVMQPKNMTQEQLQDYVSAFALKIEDSANKRRFPQLYELMLNITGYDGPTRACYVEFAEYLKIAEGKYRDEIPDTKDVEKCLFNALYEEISKNLQNADRLEEILNRLASRGGSVRRTVFNNVLELFKDALN